MRLRNPFKLVRENFSYKVFASFLVAMVLLGGAFNLVFIRYQQKTFADEMYSDGMLLARVMAHSVRLGAFAGDIEAINRAIDAAFQMDGVVSVCVMDDSGNCLTDRMISPDGIVPRTECPVKARGKEFFGRINTGEPSTYEGAAGFVEFWSPIHAGAEFTDEGLYFETTESRQEKGRYVIGYVGVSMDRNALTEGIREIMAKNVFILLIFLVFGGVITFMVARGVTKPLNKLIAEVTSHGVQVESADQLGQLSGTFEAMVAQLGEAFGTIAELKHGLEIKVNELEQEVQKRTLAEMARQESEETARTLLNAPAYLALLVNPRGEVLDVNQGMADYLGFPVEQLRGGNLFNLIPPDEIMQRRRREAEGVVRSGKPFHTEDHRNNRWFDILYYPLFDTNGRVGRVAILAREITDQKENERRRRELEVKALTQSKLASLGQIATGVAHEINQPLSFIKVIYESTLQDLEADRLDREEMVVDFREALRQVERIAGLTNHLRNFGRPDPEGDVGTVAAVNMPQVLDNALILMAERLRINKIQLIRKIDADLPLVAGHANKLEQVFINLFQNAIDVLTDFGGGVITVAMQHQAETLVTRFTDTGPGVPHDLRERIFEPFFTTKDVGKGTGLGLSIVYAIIKDHRGTITCVPEATGGTSFVIVLPAGRLED